MLRLQIPFSRLGLMTLLLLGASQLAACSKDADKDGFDEGDDCNDDDPDINPDAIEICDTIDNNCNGETDENVLTTFYRDLDGDGYGDANAEGQYCARPADYVEIPGDCSDTDPARHPGAQETDCTDPIDYNCDGSSGYADVDGDGIAACNDCNDGDADIFFGADEVCDGKDNDCDGEIDDNPVDGVTFYIDHDGDGFGDPSPEYAQNACEEDGPSGFVLDNTDCNDLAATAYPGADEVCDGLDNDCNDLVDVEDDGILDAGYYYPDFDGDGFGEEDALTRACVNLEGYIEVGGDCDDTRAAVNPDQREVCSNGLDDDCADTVTCYLDLASADATWTGSDADDNLGSSLAPAGDLNLDGYVDFLIGAEAADADADGSDEGAVYVVFGPITGGGTTSSIDDADIAIAGSQGSGRFGLAVAGLGDVNGDGAPDFASGASNNSYHSTLARTNNGAAWVFFGGASLNGSTVSSIDDADAMFFGDRSYDWIGGLVAPAGDLTGDGLSEVLIGGTGDDDGGAQSGSFYLILGAPDLASAASVATADLIIYGASASTRLGNVGRGVGDLNNDGFDDLLLGGPYVADNGSNAGATYLLLGPPPTGVSMPASSADATLYGSSANDLTGLGLAPAGDIDADGYDDVFIGSPGDNTLGGSGSGSLSLVLGSATIDTDIDTDNLDNVYSVQIHGAAPSDAIGSVIASGDDFDGDGFIDLAVGGTAAGVQGEGRVYLIYGPLSGVMDVDASSVAIFEGVDVDDSAGRDVSFLGDIGSTGRSALGITANSANQSATDAGSTYVILDVGL